VDSFLNLDGQPASDDGNWGLSRRRLADAEMDIAPMIDVTFLLLIFFLVSSTHDAAARVELPPARYGVGVGADSTVVVTIAVADSSDRATIFLADGTVGDPLPDDANLQAKRIAQAVREGLSLGKSKVLIKAERGVKHRDVSRVAAAAAEGGEVSLHLAVLEIE